MDYGTSSSGTPISFATWQTGPPARDAASIANTAATYTVGTFFASVTTGDLHLIRSAPGTPNPAETFGAAVAGTTMDFDGDTRQKPPDIGADEIVTFTVTYDGNTNTGGTAPVDPNSPTSGSTVTVSAQAR